MRTRGRVCGRFGQRAGIVVVWCAVALPWPSAVAAAPKAATSGPIEQDRQTAGRAATVASAWQPWIGCWELLDERGALLQDSREATKDTRQRPRICVAPDGDDAVAFQTVVGRDTVLTQRVVATGRPYSVEERDCRGDHRSTWSADGARLFTTAEIRCGADERRQVASVTLMTDGPTWVDIQHITVGGRGHLRVRRYAWARDQQPPGAVPPSGGPVTGSASLDARRAVSTVKLGVAALAEATSKVPVEVIEAAILESGPGLVVNKRSLLALDEANVPARIVDLLVALAYPSRFVVERPTPFAGLGGFGAPWPMGPGMFGGMPWAAYDDPFWLPYSVSPLGLAYWGGLNTFYWPAAGYVVVDAGPSPDVVRSGAGRVVNGAGYTQVSPRVAIESGAEAPSSGAAGSRGGGGRVSTQGYSSSSGGGGGSFGDAGGGGGAGSQASGGGDGGRTAQPR